MIENLLIAGLWSLLGQTLNATDGLLSLYKTSPETFWKTFSPTYLVLTLLVGFLTGAIVGHGVPVDSTMSALLPFAGYAGATFVGKRADRLV